MQKDQTWGRVHKQPIVNIYLTKTPKTRSTRLHSNSSIMWAISGGLYEKTLYYDIRLMDSIHSLRRSQVSRTYAVRRPPAEDHGGCRCCALLLVKSKEIRQHSLGHPHGDPPWWKASRLHCSASKKQANKKAKSSCLPQAFTHLIRHVSRPECQANNSVLFC